MQGCSSFAEICPPATTEHSTCGHVHPDDTARRSVIRVTGTPGDATSLAHEQRWQGEA
jgi:hypothetical protein